MMTKKRIVWVVGVLLVVSFVSGLIIGNDAHFDSPSKYVDEKYKQGFNRRMAIYEKFCDKDGVGKTRPCEALFLGALQSAGLL